MTELQKDQMKIYTLTEALRKTLLDIADADFNASMHELLASLPVAEPSTSPEPFYYLGGGRLYKDKTSALFDCAENALTELFLREQLRAAPSTSQPLTDEQIENLCRFIEPTFAGAIDYDSRIARAIEAAHGIKGGA